MAAEVGQAAPDFSLYDTERQKRGLGEFKGKNVVLAFFPRSLHRGLYQGDCALCGTRLTSITP